MAPQGNGSSNNLNNVAPRKDKMHHTPKQVNCIQINMHHSRAATQNLNHLVESHKIDLAFLQEPYNIKNKVCGMSKTMRIFTRGDRKKRAAIAVANNNITATLLTQYSHEDIVAIIIEWEQIYILAISAYFDIRVDIEANLRQIETILDAADTKKCIIAVDSNARSVMWFDVLTNIRGRIMEDFVASQQLYIANEDKETFTFETIRAKSNIDLTLVSQQLLNLINDWSIGEEESCSDHKLITFNLKQNTIENATSKPSFTKKYIVKKEKLTVFDHYITEEFLKLCDTAKPDDSLEEIDLKLELVFKGQEPAAIHATNYNTAIENACKKSFYTSGSRTGAIKGKSVPWWTDELTSKRKMVNALRRSYQRTRNNVQLREERRLVYYTEKKRYMKSINTEKTKSWKEYCTIAEGSNPWSAVYKMAAGKLKSGFTLSTIKDQDGKYTTNTKETLQCMLNEFTPEDKNEEDDEHHQRIRNLINAPIRTDDVQAFTIEEIKDALNRMNPRKAPGADGIPVGIILRTFKAFPLSVAQVYNNCLQKGYFPPEWKTSVIVPIVKPGKQDSEDASKYRPISLINVSGKLLEKLMINRITAYLNDNHLLSKNQYGFTPGKSTTDALIEVGKFVQRNTDKNNDVVLISLDVKGAFNAAWWPAILNSLREMNCPKNLYDLTNSYFSERTATITVGNTTVQKTVSRGCPQGSCCGPGYWNIQYNSLLKQKYSKHSTVIAFADDLLLLTKGRNALEAENSANTDLLKVVSWATENKITFNEEKSKVMLITKKRSSRAHSLDVYLNHKRIQQVQHVKYLGVYIDSKFSFDKHVAYITEKSTKMIHILSKSARISWGLPHSALKTIYQGAIVPMMTYGAPLWSPALRKQANCRKIRRVQRLVNIKMVKAFRTISYDASCIISGILPLEIKIEEKARLYERCLLNENSTGHPVDKNTKREITSKIQHESVEKWEIRWQRQPGNPPIKDYFPTVKSRLTVELPISPTMTTLLSGHGKLKSYYYRFKISDNPTCACGEGDQTADHLIYTCPKLETQRGELTRGVAAQGGIWPTTKADLISSHCNLFAQFVKNVDLESLI